MASLTAHPRTPPVRGAVALGVVVLAGIAALLGLVLAEDASRVGSWWPAAGLGVVGVLLTPVRQRWLVLAGLLAVLSLAYLAVATPTASVLLALGDVLEVVVVVALLRRLTGERLQELRDVVGLLLAAAVGGAVAGVSQAAVLAVAPGSGLDFAETLAMVAPAHTASVLTLAPLALLSWPRPWTLRVDALAAALLMAVLLVAGFGPAFNGLTGLALTALPLPLMVWVALRLGLHVVVLHLVWLSLVLTTTALAYPLSFGVASNDAGASTVQVVQVYLICAVLISVPLAPGNPRT